MSDKCNKSCFWLNSGIVFKRDRVLFCSYEHLSGKGENVIFSDYKGELIDYDKYLKKKNKYLSLIKRGRVPENCKNCIYLTENNISDEFIIDHITFDHWLNCNSSCIYCGQTYLPKNEKIQYYDVYPVIKDMFDKGILKPTKYSCIIFGGGEPTLLKEFDKLTLFFSQNGFKNIRVNSSGIIYSEILSDALKSGCASLVISLDAGSKAVHEKVKKVKSFDSVISNIKKYGENLTEGNNLIVKYIIIPGINDKIEEINLFFDILVNLNIKKTALSVEANWYSHFKPNFPDMIFEKFDYFINKSKELGINCEIICEAGSLLKTAGK